MNLLTAFTPLKCTIFLQITKLTNKAYQWAMLFSVLVLPVFQATYAQPPAIQLATLYRQNINIEQYYVSEKLDGIRAYWDGQHLVSKQGHIFTAPIWFTQSFPTAALDGELWIGRQKFEQVSSIVSTQDINNPLWQQVKFMVFDLPTSAAPFSSRVRAIRQLVTKTNSRYLQVVKQQKISTNKALFLLLDDVVANHGEGLMLHHQDAIYQQQRSRDLMKLKKFIDAEATVIGHSEGKGKYAGLLGSLVVRTPNGVEFKIGSGFSDLERRNPPPIGSTITYRYTGKTRNNVPKFASFMRVRVIY